jgi:uncharacterized protein (TIGR00251 family)
LTDLRVNERAGSIRFDVRVQPRASRDRIDGVHGGALRVRVTAPPVEGAANEALIRLLAEFLRVNRADVRVISGLSSRNKIVQVDGVSKDRLDRALFPP